MQKGQKTNHMILVN